MSVKTNKDRVIQLLIQLNLEKQHRKFTASDIAHKLGLQRSNTSAILNELHKEGRLNKEHGKPVQFSISNHILSETGHIDSFKTLLGSEGTLNKPIQLAKAATLYPNMSLPILIMGPKGSGRQKFTEQIKVFSKVKKQILNLSESIEVNCLNYEDKSELNNNLKEISDSTVTNTFINIRNIENLDVEGREILTDIILQKSKNNSIICSLDSVVSPTIQDVLKHDFPVVIEIPSLKDRPLKEKLGIIQKFFQEEAKSMSRTIKLNADILSMLLIYKPEGDIAQLKKDIIISCANAYVREFENKSKDLYLYFNDFPVHVRNGITRYSQNKDEINALIKIGGLYAYNSDEIFTDNNKDKSYHSIYEVLEEKASSLKDQGLSSEEVNLMLSSDIKDYFKIVEDATSIYGEVSGSIGKIVSQEIIVIIRDFLEEAANELGRIYEKSTFYSLCIHVSKAIERVKFKETIDYKIFPSSLIQNDKELYLSSKLVKKVSEVFSIELPSEEIPILAMFLMNKNDEKNNEDSPVVLIAMHGDNVATSMAKVVNDFLNLKNVYAFDLPLDGDINNYYSKLKSLIMEIEKTHGVLMIYDMGSLKTMAESIAQDTQIEIKTLEVPGTLIAMDAARKANTTQSLDQLYDSVVDSYDLNYRSIRKDYAKLSTPQVIITLCMSGEGGAVQIKEYIDKYIEGSDIITIPLSMADPVLLQEEIRKIKEDHRIKFFVGASNPNIFGIPFLSISDLFSSPKDKVPELLSIIDKGPKKDSVNKIYSEVFEFLETQLDNLDMESLRDIMPKVMKSIKAAYPSLNMDQELGLLLHISANIHRIQEGKFSKVNPYKKAVIDKNKRLYYKLKDIFIDLEKTFNVEFTDDEFANIITILKKI